MTTENDYITKTEKDLFAEINWAGLEKYLKKFFGVRIDLTVTLENEVTPYFVSKDLVDQSGILQKLFKSIMIKSFDSIIDVDTKIYKCNVHIVYQMNEGGILGSKLCSATYDINTSLWNFN